MAETYLSQKIADFVVGITCETLPKSTVAVTKRLVLDTLGCALGGIGAEPVALLQGVAPDAA
ncbi:MAG: hypothetical protein HOM25_21995, partial [Rhodospirillaceae bacterium]|nr:hypothetical protein [Rhodospirillaceae bacterium]